MKSIIAACLLLLTLDSCSDRTALPEPVGDLTIRSGPSFGMCAGYCLSDYTFTGTNVTLVQSALRTQAQNPPKTCQTTSSQADWEALVATVNFDTFSQQPQQLGCPDCADGGLEYIELQSGDRKHRVNFEFGKTIPGSEALVNALRSRREAFAACN